ncbi:MAG TPA: ATP-grasp domain-containing protein [Pseudogracilibacillus sp.]|nr:ATP-grasp domain-containing protein [Pseudogracilibacillus sp.]
MMKGWLIYDRAAKEMNESYIAWFIEEAAKQEIDLQLILRDEITFGIENCEQIIYLDGKKVLLPSFVIIRTIEPTLQFYFENLGVPTFNDAKTAMICNHKTKTYIEMSKLDIPTVPTYFLSKQNVPTSLPLPFPFVLKEATGRSGKQVYYVKNEAEWQDKLSRLTSNDVIIQCADVALGRDVRVFVIGKEIIGAVLRKNDADFRANFTLGGDAIPYQLTSAQDDMIKKITQHFDFGLVGIDFLVSKNGRLLFNEIEDVVGSRILSKVSNVNLLEMYVSFIKEKLKNKR